MASNRRHSTRTRKIREKKQQTKKNYITNVAVDECDFRIYCGVLEIQTVIQNRRSRENTVNE